MPNIKISIHQRSLEARKEALMKWKIPDKEKKKLLEFLDDLNLGKVNKGIKITEARQIKYLDLIKTSLEFFNKPSEKLTIKDVEHFDKQLSSDKIKSHKGTPFADSTKVDLRRSLKIFLNWRLGDKARKLTDWFDLRVKRKTPDYLSEQEIEKLYKNCKNSEERFLISVLFDSGARAEEFHNIRYEDIHLPHEKDAFVKITLKEEYSKTKGRVISLYWKFSFEAVKEYLQERRQEGLRMDEPVFKNKYANARQILFRLGKKVLKKPIHYHLFRHSSATYYAPKMNRQELCYRYGWAFSSDMPDVYISRSGMENKQLDEKFTQTELSELQIKLQRQEQANKIAQDTMQKQIENERLDKESMIQDLRKQIEDEVKKRLHEEEKHKKTKTEVDWDNMVFQRMVEEPEIVPKLLKTMKKIWKNMEEEHATKK